MALNNETDADHGQQNPQTGNTQSLLSRKEPALL
jgi:hypothetical protein